MDTFVDDTAWCQRGARPSREDVPMPDYVSVSSSSSRPLSGLTGFSFEHSKQPSITARLDDDQYNDLIQSLTPTKAAPAVGTRAPSNSPSVIMPPPKRLAPAEARSARYTRSRRTSALTDGSQPSTREVSGASLMSLTSDNNGKKESEKDRNKESKKEPKRKASKEVLKETQKEIQESQKEVQKKTEKGNQEETQVEEL